VPVVARLVQKHTHNKAQSGDGIAKPFSNEQTGELMQKVKISVLRLDSRQLAFNDFKLLYTY